MIDERIERVSIKTRSGNTLELFYNAKTGLCVLDLIAKNDRGGNELYRRILVEEELLEHTEVPA